MIVTVPALIPVTTPNELIVAMPVFDEAHGVVACTVAVPVNVVVLPTQVVNVPLILGKALMIKNEVPGSLSHVVVEFFTVKLPL